MSDITANIVTSDTLTANILCSNFSVGASDTPKRYRRTFTSADLDINRILTVSHNLTIADLSVIVAVYDNSNKWVLVRPTLVDEDSLTIDFGSIPVSGTWRLIVMA